ncbi:hypothetical protein [Cyclobacterium plantarum]|uniref:Uncharacterized protein n=1 Tax=Cyclobacterium plantarum TaxID=2716263 RepID=A0ABX0HG36_9BACT|nr:hypothetical protein [Cyclobacterium plantarum]NHE59268.1 hypothetical protein [Cyclobacterium plantarum]
MESLTIKIIIALCLMIILIVSISWLKNNFFFKPFRIGREDLLSPVVAMDYLTERLKRKPEMDETPQVSELLQLNAISIFTTKEHKYFSGL